MGRRVSSGKIGAPGVGGLLASAQTITADTDVDIVIDPLGTGRVLVDGHLQVQNQSNLRFGDLDDSNYVAFRAPTTVSSDVTWTLPDADGSTNQFLRTDGAGNLSFVDATLNLSDEVSDSNTHYPLITTSTSGTLADARVSSTKISFVPSTGVLTATAFNGDGTNVSNVTAVATVTSNNFQMNSLGVGTAGSGTAGEIRATNQITAYYSSDERLKENITNIENPLEKLRQINGVEYDWTDSYIEAHGGEDGYFVRKHDIGLIAQEVEQVLPEIVAENSEGFKAVKYERVVALLVEAVKELQDQIKNLEN